ncbi:MAG: acetyl-CoA carboxylase biotin carboxyl carrier protein [Candidatus Omnitrophota bacterium]|nr:acetyl-CoA carboxylase biotin carboxyl carrier protein [Candidatus Omnitrophota bacterium]
MNLKEIKEMINLMNENNLLELEIEREGMRIKLKRGSLESTTALPAVEYRIEHLPATNIASTKEVLEERISIKTLEIKSPMVGTFYLAPSPEAAPFVDVGQEVEVGQVICIIEAMKLMNEIKSEIKGRMIEALVDNAEPVEFGQPLFLIEPT